MENALLIAVSVAVVVIAVVSVPVLLQLWRTARNLAQTLQTLNQTLPAILKNLEEITTHVNRTATMVDREVEDFSATLRRLRGTLGLIAGVEEIVRRNLNLAFVRRVRTSAAVAKGARVFLEQLLSRQPEKTDCR